MYIFTTINANHIVVTLHSVMQSVHGQNGCCFVTSVKYPKRGSVIGTTSHIYFTQYWCVYETRDYFVL